MRVVWIELESNLQGSNKSIRLRSFSRPLSHRYSLDRSSSMTLHLSHMPSVRKLCFTCCISF